MEYNSIRLSTLRGDQKTTFDLFIALNGKYIHYIREGSSFEGERLSRLKEKKLKKLYIPIDQEEKYRKYIAMNAEIAYDEKSGKSIEDRSQIVHGLQQSNAEAVYEAPESKEAYAQAKLGSDKFAEMLIKEDKAVKNLIMQENTDKNLGHHGVTVSTVAVQIAKLNGTTEAKQLGLLALCGLLHDVGHLNSDIVISRPLAEFSKEELAKYKEHPKAGAEKVAGMGHFDPEVIKVILEHEELINGSGYPAKLIEKKMHAFSILVGCANALDRMVTFENVKLDEAIKDMLLKKIGLYPLPYLKSLKSLI